MENFEKMPLGDDGKGGGLAEIDAVNGITADIGDVGFWSGIYNSSLSCGVWVLPFMSMKFPFSWHRDNGVMDFEVRHLLEHIRMPSYRWF